MNVLVSSSPAPRAHPPRSNPFLRSSDAAPFPCITPSRVTWVMVVSFMIAVPLPWRRPLWAASPLLRTPPPRSDTPSRTSLKNFPGRRSSSLRQHDSFAATALRLLKHAQRGQAPGPDRPITKILTSRPHMPPSERYGTYPPGSVVERTVVREECAGSAYF